MSQSPMVLSLAPEADFWEMPNHRWCNFLCKPSCLSLFAAWGEPAAPGLSGCWVTLCGFLSCDHPGFSEEKRTSLCHPKLLCQTLYPTLLLCLFWVCNPSWCPYPSIYLFLFVTGWSTEQPVLSQFHEPHHAPTHLFLRTRSPDLLMFDLPCILSLNSSPSAHGELWWCRMRQGHFHIRIISWQHYCCSRKCQPWPHIPSEGFARVFIKDGIFSITTVGSRQSLNWKNNSGAV